MLNIKKRKKTQPRHINVIGIIYHLFLWLVFFLFSQNNLVLIMNGTAERGRVSNAWGVSKPLDLGTRTAVSYSCTYFLLCAVHPDYFISLCFSYGFFSRLWVCKHIKTTCKVGNFFSLRSIVSFHGSPQSLWQYQECHSTPRGSSLKLIIKNKIEGFKTYFKKSVSFHHCALHPSYIN